MTTSTTTLSTPSQGPLPTGMRRAHVIGHRGRIPLERIVGVELRKSVDTRSGFWLLIGIGIASLLTSGAVIAWAPRSELAYSQFTLATGVPISVILPIIAALSVTSEWTQRTGLATFTLVPHRGRVLLAKALAALLVAVVSTGVALAVGALGNLAGSAVVDVDPVWDLDLTAVVGFGLANALLVLVGFALGALIRNSPGAIVGYMIYAFVLPGLLALLALSQEWFHDARPWIDAKYNQDALLRGDALTSDAWLQVGATSLVWVVLPLVVAVHRLRRSEVK